jgi:hypothetical protein
VGLDLASQVAEEVADQHFGCGVDQALPDRSHCPADLDIARIVQLRSSGAGIRQVHPASAVQVSYPPGTFDLHLKAYWTDYLGDFDSSGEVATNRCKRDFHLHSIFPFADPDEFLAAGDTGGQDVRVEQHVEGALGRRGDLLRSSDFHALRSLAKSDVDRAGGEDTREVGTIIGRGVDIAACIDSVRGYGRRCADFLSRAFPALH